MYKIDIRYTNRLFADGIEQIVNDYPGISVINTHRYDQDDDPGSFITEESFMTILEIDYPKNSDVEYIEKVLVAVPDALILLVSQEASVKLSQKLINSGIAGYLLKNCSKNDLESAIRKILDAKSYFCTDITKRIINDANNGNHMQTELSSREKEILRLIANNHSISTVADHLSISENTVKTHKKNILSKLGVHNTLGLFLYAIRHEMIDAGDHDLCNYCPYFSHN